MLDTVNVRQAGRQAVMEALDGEVLRILVAKDFQEGGVDIGSAGQRTVTEVFTIIGDAEQVMEHQIALTASKELVRTVNLAHAREGQARGTETETVVHVVAADELGGELMHAVGIADGVYQADARETRAIVGEQVGDEVPNLGQGVEVVAAERNVHLQLVILLTLLHDLAGLAGPYVERN